LPLTCLDPEFVELVALVVSQDNSCRYCYAATRSMLKILGFPDERIRRLEEDMLAAELSPAQQAGLAFARRVSRANPLASRADAEPLRLTGYGLEAAKELTFTAAINVFFNRIATLPALPTEVMERLADHWYVKLLRQCWRASCGAGASPHGRPDCRLISAMAPLRRSRSPSMACRSRGCCGP